MKLEETYALVEKALQNIGVNVEECRGDDSGSWTLNKDDHEIWIDVWEIETENNDVYFQVMSPVLQLPNTTPASLYKEALDTNEKLFAVAFAIKEGDLVLRSIREAENLDLSEVLSTIHRVANYALEYGDPIYKKYSGSTGAIGDL